MKIKKKLVLGLTAGAMISVGSFVTTEVKASDSGSVNMYRLYHRGSHEHFYTGDLNEAKSLVKGGWAYEGVGFVAPKKSSIPVYRLYNAQLNDHHYTTSKNERDTLVAKHGWKNEGIGWYSSDDYPNVMYRLYNPALTTGAHHYTTSMGESQQLTWKQGWKSEGTAWRVKSDGDPNAKLGEYTTPNSTWMKNFQAEMLRLVNKERKSLGVKTTLKYNKADAQAWSNYLRDNHLFKHGFTADKWKNQAQNICAFPSTSDPKAKESAKEAFEMWKGSSAHSSSMMNKAYSFMDVGIAFGLNNSAVATMNLH
jgi:uncharacterized protein YkwD